MNRNTFISDSFNSLRNRGIIHTQKDFARLLDVDPGQLSRAMKGDPKHISDNLIAKVQSLLNGQQPGVPMEWVKEFPSLDSLPTEKVETLPIIPTEAIAGTLGDFASQVSEYECERMISPVKGADYAMKVWGDSMIPEFPNGCLILIKKVNENAFIEWGKVYVLDTENGAVIKKIRKTDRDNVVECVSLNPEFQPFTIDTSFIHGWYRVLMVLSLK